MDFERIYSERFDETLLMGKHKSGLNVAIIPKKGFSKYYAIYGTQYGSIDREFVALGENEKTILPDGVAHFLEHKLFEMPDGSNAFDSFSQTGGNSNAFTSFNITAYLFSCTEKFYENLDILLDFVNKPYFTDENVAKEQGIIGQEIKMYDDDPSWRVFFNMLTAMYHKNPVRRDIAGSVESISHITPKLLYKCVKTFYNPSNMYLVLVGDIDENEVEKYIDKSIPSERESGEVIRYTENEPPEIFKERISQTLSVSKPLFCIGFKEKQTGIRGFELLKKDLATEILLELMFGKSGENFMQMYESGIIDASFSYETELEEEYGFTSFSGETKDPEEVFAKIKEYIETAKKDGFLPENIKRIKKAVLSDEIRMYNSVENIGNTYIKSLMKGINPLDCASALDEIDNDYLMARLNEHFDTSNCVLSVVNPAEAK